MPPGASKQMRVHIQIVYAPMYIHVCVARVVVYVYKQNAYNRVRIIISSTPARMITPSTFIVINERVH